MTKKIASGLMWGGSALLCAGVVHAGIWTYNSADDTISNPDTPWVLSVCKFDARLIVTGVKTMSSTPLPLADPVSGYPITDIGNFVFEDCTALSRITIPDSVIRISDWAFSGCNSLTGISVSEANTVYCDIDGVLVSKDKKRLLRCPAGKQGAYDIPDSVTSIDGNAFSGCNGLTGVTIPGSVTNIGAYAFSHCGGLTRVAIPHSLARITPGAFYRCDGLTGFSVSDANTAYCDIDGVLFSKDKTRLVMYPAGRQGAYDIPDSVTSIGDSAFYGCDGLIGVTIPGSVTNIGAYAFSRCGGLTHVTIPDSVTRINYSAFSDCGGLTNVTIGNGVTRIGNGAFSNCRSLTNVTIGKRMTRIFTVEFVGCSRLIGISVPEANTAYCDIDGVLFSKDKTRLVMYPAGRQGAYDIPDSVTSIGDNAFSGCGGLASVTIPGSVTNIGAYAFSHCGGLTHVTIPDSVTSIGNGAFSGCDGLGGITIPDSVNNIDKCTFLNCGGLSRVTIPDSVTNISYSAFSNCNALPHVTIPDSVTSLGAFVFSGCDALTNVTFNGVCPATAEPSLYGSPSNVTTYIYREHLADWNHKVTRGPIENGSAIWQERPIRLLDVAAGFKANRLVCQDAYAVEL